VASTTLLSRPARYRFDLASRSRHVPVSGIVLLALEGQEDDVRAGGARGLVLARAALLERGLATCRLTATRIAR
jgi:hypothetical protein